ncbi:MAG TPA: hypothetical protein VLZ74_09240 [Methylocella sp.]|nr:hypothetical protein [Methylocella sp.]
MIKFEDNEGLGGDDVRLAQRPEQSSNLFPRTPERALFVSSALTVVSFLIHIFFLLLIDPWKVLKLSKEAAYVYSGFPLAFGAVFLGLSVYYFIKIENRSVSHIVMLLVALSLGSMSIQGLLGLGLHYVLLSLMSA